MADRGRLLDEFGEESGSSGEETTFEEMQSRMSSLETMLQHARRERLNAVRHARSQLKRARVLMQRNQQDYQDKPNQEPNDRTKVSLLFEGRLSKMFEDVSPLMSPGYTSPSIGSPLDSEFEVHKSPRRLSYGDELFFDEDGTSYLGNQNGSVSRNELFQYRLGNYESAGMGVPYRRHEITVHRVEIRESRSNRRKSRRDTRPQREKSAEQGELRATCSQDTQWTERVPYGYDDVRRSAVSLRSSNYIQRPVLPQTRASRAEAASFPRSPAGSMTSPARPSKSNPRAKGSSPKNKPRAQQYDNRQMSRNKDQRNEKHFQRRLDSRVIASTAGDTVNRRDSGIHRDSGTHRFPMSEDKRSITFSHSVHAALVEEMINAQQLKARTPTANIPDPGYAPSLAGSHKSSPLVVTHASSSASDKSRIQSGRSRPTSEESTYAPRSTSDENSRERRNRAINRHESTAVPPNSIEARSERSVATSRDSSSTVPSLLDDRSRADSQWNHNYIKQGSIAVHNHAEKIKALQGKASRPDASISFHSSTKPREKSQTRQERGLNTHSISHKEEHTRGVSIVKSVEKSSAQTRSHPPAQTHAPRMQASATTQTIMNPVPPTGRQPPNQAQTTPRAQPPPKTPSRPLIESPSVKQSLPPSENIQSPQHEEQAQLHSQAQPPPSNSTQPVIETPLPASPPSPAQPPPSTLTPKPQPSPQPSTEDTMPIEEHTSSEVQSQPSKQPPPRPPPPTRLPPSPVPPLSSSPSPALPRSSTPSPASARSSTPSPAPPRSSTPSPAYPRSSTPSPAPPRSSTPSTSSPPSRPATPPHIRTSMSAKVSISTHPPQTKIPPSATPQSQMTSSRSMTPPPPTPPATRASLSSSRPPSSAKASPKPSITSRSSTGSKTLPFSRPQSTQSAKPSPKISSPSKSPSPPRASFAKQSALTATLIETLTKGQNPATKFPIKSSLAQQSYQVARSGPSSPSIRPSIPSASHRSVSGFINKMGSVASDVSRRPLMRNSLAQERRITMKQEAASPTPSKMTERPSLMEAKKISLSPAHRSVESRSPSIKTPTGSPISKVPKITEIQKEKSRTSSPVTSEKRLAKKEARVSPMGVVEGRRMQSSASRQISPSKIGLKDEKQKSISPSPLITSPRRQSMSERVVAAANATRSTSNGQTLSRDTIGGSPVKSEGTKAMKPRQSLMTTRQSVMTAESSLLSAAERRQSLQRRSSAATSPRVSSVEKRQTKTIRAPKVASTTDESKKVSQVPGSVSFDAHIPGEEVLQKTIELTPSDKRVTSSETPLPEKRVTLPKPTASEKREAPSEPPSKPADIISSDKRISSAEPHPKPVAPTSSEKRITSTKSHPKVEGRPTAQKDLSVVESLPKTEAKPFHGTPEVPLRLVSSDKYVSVSEKRDIPRQAPSLMELTSGKQTEIPKKSSAIPAKTITPKVPPTGATVPIGEKITKTSSEKRIPVQHKTSRKGLEMKMSGEGMEETKQPRLEKREDSTIKRPHTLSAPISETKMVPEEKKPLTSQSEPKELEKIPQQPTKIPRKAVEGSKPATPHSEQISLEKLRGEMSMTARSSLDHSSSVRSSDRLTATAKGGSFPDMDAQASSSTNVAERTDTIGDLPSIKRQKYHKYRKDEGAMNDDAERRKPSSGPSESDLGESSEVEDHSLHGLIEFFC